MANVIDFNSDDVAGLTNDLQKIMDKLTKMREMTEKFTKEYKTGVGSSPLGVPAPVVSLHDSVVAELDNSDVYLSEMITQLQNNIVELKKYSADMVSTDEQHKNILNNS